MSVLNQILVALGVFFAAYAGLALLHGRGTGPQRRARPLGCGFTVLAAFVWSVALSRYLQSAGAGVRLGTACALILPALATLTRPGRSNILGAAMLLTMAVLLGAPVLPTLRARLRPSQSGVTVRELDRAVVELNRGIEGTTSYLAELKNDRARLQREIKTLGFPDFDSIAADSKGLLLLQELASLDQLHEDTAERLDAMHHNAARIEVAARRVERLHDAETATGIEVTRGELEAILDTTAGAAPETVEEHVARARLQSLFEREFGAVSR